MKNWQKALIITLITLAIGGIYLLVVFEHRRNPGVAQQTNPEQSLTPDDVAVVRMMFPTSFDDVLKLAEHQRVDEERLHHTVLPVRKRPHRFREISRRHSLRATARHQESDQGRGARAGRRWHLAWQSPGFRGLRAARQRKPLRRRHRRH